MSTRLALSFRGQLLRRPWAALSPRHVLTGESPSLASVTRQSGGSGTDRPRYFSIVRESTLPHPLVLEPNICDGAGYKTSLSPYQLNELLRGRFPADYYDNSIYLKDLPRTQFRGIVKAFDPFKHMESEKKPSGHIFFDKKFSNISVFRAPTLLHDAAVHNISESVLGIIQTKVPNYQSKFTYQTNAVERRMAKSAEFTSKIPDFMLSYCFGDTPFTDPVFLAEVGFSESYPSLVKTMKYWLEGNDQIKLTFLVKFTETPRYSTRRALEHLPKDVVENAELHATDKSLVRIDTCEGRVNIHGSSFVGKIRAFLEIWKRDSDTGDVSARDRRSDFYDSSISNDTPPPNCVIGFDELGIPVEELRGEKITIDYKKWVMGVEMARKQLAWERFREVLLQQVAKQRGK